MSRPLRVAVVGGWYHVTARGTGRQQIFLDDRDREHALEVLGELPERFGVEIHVYVLMDNHFHLLVRTPRANLSAAMQWFNGSYSRWFIARRGRSGPVLRGPFKGILVDGNGAWALELSRYIHLNPVRVAGLGWDKLVRRQEQTGVAPAPSAELVKSRLKVLRQWRWSSYRAYTGLSSAPEWLTREELWRRSRRAGLQDARAYRRLVEEAVRLGEPESPWENLRAGMAMGSRDFVEAMRRLVRGDPREQPAVRQWAKAVPWEQVVAAVERAKGERWEVFRDRKGDAGRDVALWLARHRCGLTLRALAEKVDGLSALALSKALTRMDAKLKVDRGARVLRDQTERIMSNV